MDVVVLCGPNDYVQLSTCIESIRRCVWEARRIVVIAPADAPKLEGVEYFDERHFPFSPEDVAARVPGPRSPWYFQQLLKFYALRVVQPRLTDAMMIVDSDVVFLRKMRFFDDAGCALHNTSVQNHQPYMAHMARLLPGLRRANPNESGISHHMVFRRAIVDDLFARVESVHEKPFWESFLDCLDPRDRDGSGASEYEIYHNFALLHHPNAVRTRTVAYQDHLFKQVPKAHYVSVHHYHRPQDWEVQVQKLRQMVLQESAGDENHRFSIVFAPRGEPGAALARFAALGLPTLRRWVDPKHVRDVWVVAPSADALEPLRRQAPAMPWRAVTDLHNHACAALAAAGRAKTETVIVLDEDAVLTRPLLPHDVWLNDGRLRMAATDGGMVAPLDWLAAAEACGSDWVAEFEKMQDAAVLPLDQGAQAMISAVAAEAVARLRPTSGKRLEPSAVYWYHAAAAHPAKHALDVRRSLALPFADQPHVDVRDALKKAFAPDGDHLFTWVPSQFFATPVALDAVLNASN